MSSKKIHFFKITLWRKEILFEEKWNLENCAVSG